MRRTPRLVHAPAPKAAHHVTLNPVTPPVLAMKSTTPNGAQAMPRGDCLASAWHAPGATWMTGRTRQALLRSALETLAGVRASERKPRWQEYFASLLCAIGCRSVRPVIGRAGALDRHLDGRRHRHGCAAGLPEPRLHMGASAACCSSTRRAWPMRRWASKSHGPAPRSIPPSWGRAGRVYQPYGWLSDAQWCRLTETSPAACQTAATPHYDPGHGAAVPPHHERTTT